MQARESTEALLSSHPSQDRIPQRTGEAAVTGEATVHRSWHH